MKTWHDCVLEAKRAVKLLHVHEVKEMMETGEEFILIDVRESEEYQRGSIPGSVVIPRGVLEMEVEDKFPDRTTPIVLHCMGGGRSAMAAQSLKNMGYANVASMEGGFRGWAQSGYPVSSP